MATSEELYQKERLLRALATDLESVFDKAHRRSGSELWQCANADEVRTAIGGYRGAAQRAAERIRTEADTVHRRAVRAEEEETAGTPQ